MSDLISRQDVLDAIDKYILGKPEGDKVEVRELLKLITKIYRMPSAQPEIIRCKECKHFHYDMPYVIQGVPVLGHEVCDFWGDGCKTSENGFCSYAERRTDG